MEHLWIHSCLELMDYLMEAQQVLPEFYLRDKMEQQFLLGLVVIYY